MIDWLGVGGIGDGRCIYLLCSALVSALVLVVDAAEVRNNDWHRQSDDQDTTEGADGSENLASNGAGHHVSISGARGGKARSRKVPTHPSVPHCIPFIPTHSVTLARHSNSEPQFLALQNVRDDLSGHQWGSNENGASVPTMCCPPC